MDRQTATRRTASTQAASTRTALRTATAGFEPLEGRRLMSVSLNPATHVLTATGTAGSDEIVVSLKNGKIRVSDNGTTHDYAPAQVNRIVINGLGGNDSLRGSDAVTKPMTINGGDGVDFVRGGGGNDALNGGAGNDAIEGGLGNDALTGAAGADDLKGGSGTDTVDYGYATLGCVVSLDDVANDGMWFIFSEGDNAHSDVENVLGSGKADTITGSSAANALDGRGGADTVVGGGGNDALHGGADNDTLRGGAGNDALYGDAGDDFLDAENGSIYEADTFWGGTGRDTVSYASRTVGIRIQLDDVANDGFADDHGSGTEHDNVHTDIEVAVGGAGADGLYGNAFANELIGGGGSDYIDGAGGPDVLRGGAGDDVIYAKDNFFFETVDGGAGNDTAWIDDIGFGVKDNATSIESLM
ncbi:MAG: Alkaline phosphatase [Phycisphaerales bacterium]|nr:Alkaline phosphatase [Phycisphaerales bacterium]